jgi:hypothetical protein
MDNVRPMYTPCRELMRSRPYRTNLFLVAATDRVQFVCEINPLTVVTV